MLAKLIVHAATRPHAIERLKYALDETVLLGIGSNQDYLRSLCEHPQVREGKVNVGFLEESFSGYHPKADDSADVLASALDLGLGTPYVSGNTQTGALPSPWFSFSQGATP